MIALLLVLVGCAEDTDSGIIEDTAWWPDTGDTDCDDYIVRTWPDDGDDDWYWRAPPTVLARTDAQEAYAARLLDADGELIETETVWVENSFRVVFDGALDPLAGYMLQVADCHGPRDIGFTTSAYGTPLAIAGADLVGRTYAFDMSTARWDQPIGFGTLLSLYFTTPILIGVESVSGGAVDLLGAQGKRDDSGMAQVDSEPTWDFPEADFSQAPYFTTVADQITVEFDEVYVPIHDFALSATFAADGTTMGGGAVSGIGDTRNMGPLLNQPNNPAAVCNIASGAGAPCEPCPDDGEPYCLRLSARDATGVLVEGLTLVPVP